MSSHMATESKHLIRRVTDRILRRAVRTSRWAQQALPGKRIHWHRRRLDDFAAKLETRFVHVSTRLENLSARSTMLLDSSRRLLQYSLGDDETSTFQSAVAVMERPMKFNDECLAITEKLGLNLAQVAGRIGRLHHFKSTLDASIAPLRIMQTMFRIESAASSPGIQTLFFTLSGEIERLLFGMSTMIAGEFAEIERTGAKVSEVIARLGGIRTLQVRAQARRSEIGESLRKLEAQIQTNQEKDVRLIGATQAVSEKIAGMVTALQYQDILNQRLQHVLRGLKDLSGRSEALKGDSGFAELSHLRDASRVESAHLEDVEGVLGDVLGTLRGALDGLAAEMDGLDDQSVLLDGVDSSSAACDGMVQVLLDTIGENLQLTESASARSQEIFSVLEPIGILLGNLTGNMLELSSRIRLIALNAQIHAAQAGDGTGLEVLSSSTRSVAEEMAHIVTEIATELAALKDGLKTGLEDVEYTRRRSLEFLQFLREDGADHELKLHAFRNRMLAELRRVGELIAHVRTESRSLSASLDMSSAALAVVSGARREFHEFSDGLSARLGKGAKGGRFEQHNSLYTAASERAAHERALRVDGASADLAPTDAAPLDPSDDSAIGESQTGAEGSIELF